MNSKLLGFEKLSKLEKEEVISDLIYSIVNCRNLKESILFLQDLLTQSELLVLSRRLRIAKLLLGGNTYEEISEKLHVSHTTVAKISFWLADKGEGFRKIIKTLPKKKDAKDPINYDLHSFKRSHSMYFWPELLLEEIIKSADEKQKHKLRESIRELNKGLARKNRLHRDIEKLLFQRGNSKALHSAEETKK